MKKSLITIEFKRIDGKDPVTNDPVVDYTYEHPGEHGLKPHPFVVRASHEGVQIMGHSPVVRQNYQLEPLAKALGAAMKDHVRLEKEQPLCPTIPSQ